MTIIVKQIGFTPVAGSLLNLVDGNLTTFWQPAATDFFSYQDPFLTVMGEPNVGKNFVALEFDLGLPLRVPLIQVRTETVVTLGPAMLIGSDFPASSAADVVQAGDVLMGMYTTVQITSNLVLETAARLKDIRKRYYRLCQHFYNAPLSQSGGSGQGPDHIVGDNFSLYNAGSGDFTVVPYTTLTIEGWGGGASGGLSPVAVSGTDTTVSTYSLLAHGGAAPTATVANSSTGFGIGGTASGGNTANLTGGNGGAPSPASILEGLSGKGGDAPNGGPGGGNGGEGSSSPVYGPNLAPGAGGVPTIIDPGVFYNGHDGYWPGGGGSGQNLLMPISGGQYIKNPGGGAGGYFKHVFTFGVSGSPAVGALISFAVGLGGIPTAKGDGQGAPGRVKFSWV